jgi:hypothetical protein
MKDEKSDCFNNCRKSYFVAYYNFKFLSRKAFKITETELKVIAALAIIGLRACLQSLRQQIKMNS